MAQTAPVIDLDRHVIEPDGFWREAFRSADAQRMRAAFWVEGEGTGARAWLNGEPIAAYPPGARRSPGARPGGLRALLDELDEQGVEHALLVPVRSMAYLPWIEDAAAAALFARAANRWWAEETHALAPERLHPLALLAAGEPSDAIAEVEHAKSLGLRAAWICPAFDRAGRHPGQRALRPLWEALARADLAAYVHAVPWCPGGSDRAYAGLIRDLVSPLGEADEIAAAFAPAMDCDALLMALLADGLLEALPQLRLVFADAGAAWLPLALEKTEAALWLCHQDEPVCLEPAEVFAAGEHLVCFDALDGSVQRMPARFARIAAWGSGSSADAAPPAAQLRGAGIPEPVLHDLLGGNASRVLRLAAP
jgi:predicted TIM-barrel fold metal-dependent hydrolase